MKAYSSYYWFPKVGSIFKQFPWTVIQCYFDVSSAGTEPAFLICATYETSSSATACTDR